MFVVTCVLAVLLVIALYKIRKNEQEKLNTIVAHKTAMDKQFHYAFKAGWNDALSHPSAVKASYERFFAPKKL